MLGNVEKNFRRETASPDENDAIDQRIPEVIHEMVLENAATGGRSLYLSPNHTTVIENMSETEGRALFDALMDHAFQRESIYKHERQNGDVLKWDYTRLLHLGEGLKGRIPRLAKRTTVYVDPVYFTVPNPVLENPQTKSI